MVKRVEHRMTWGETPGGRRYALCSCGFRAPVRSKLTHGMSDVRDHLRDVRERCRAAGWRWEMVRSLGLVTFEDDEPVGDAPRVAPHDQSQGVI
jgi:hypothetical protein